MTYIGNASYNGIVNTGDITDGAVTAAKLASGAVAVADLTMSTARILGRSTASTGAVEEITVGSGLSLSGGALTASGGGAFKNKIIGGDFTINPWQRGTSFTALAHQAYCADRWRAGYSTDGVVDCLKTADAPTVAEAGVFTQHCLHADVTTADAAIASGQYYALIHIVEGINSASFGFGQSGTRYVTLSFWHKHTKTGTYCVGLRNSSNTRSYVAEYTQDVTNTWEKATVTVPVDTSGTWLYDNGMGIIITFSVAAGSTYHTPAGAWTAGNFFASANQVNALDSTSNDFKLALVQLEAGSSATDFDVRSVGQELALCQRYYEKSNSPNSYGGSGNGFIAFRSVSTTPEIYIKFTTPKRAPPSTVTYYSVGGSFAAGNFRNLTASSDLACSSIYGAETGITVYNNGGGTANNEYGFHYAADAEL